MSPSDATDLPESSDDESTLFVPDSSRTAEGAGETEVVFRIGPYHVERELGRGGMGVVYLARDHQLSRTVAIKILPSHFAYNPKARARFRREAEAASRLDHPGLCGIIAAGEDDGTPWIAMPYIEGVPLSTLVAEAREGAGVTAATSPDRGTTAAPGSSWSSAAEMVVSISRALQVAHDAGILHRDLKPANIMVRPDGRPVIMDFGLAGDAREEGPELTASGDVFGTPNYMAPEQIRGEVHRAEATLDVWALGVILYELLTNRPPFEAPTRDGVYRNILEREPASLRSKNVRCPADLQIVLSTALEKDPRRRYGTARDFADDLKRVLDIEPILARSPGLIDRTVKWARRRPALTTLIVVLAVFIPTVLGLVGERFLTTRRVSANVSENLRAARAALRRRDPAEADRLLDEVADLEPDHVRLATLRDEAARAAASERVEGLILDREVDPTGDLAAAELAAVSARWPADEDWPRYRELLDVRLGKTEATPDSASGYRGAMMLSAAGRHEDARRLYLELLDDRPRFHWLAWAAADEASRVQRYDEALALARAARAACGTLAPRRRGRYSLHLRRAGALELALEHATRACEESPDDAILLLHLANALAELRRTDEAFKHLEHALEMRPDFVEAWRALGALQIDVEDYTAAEASLRKARELAPKSPEIANNLATVLVELHRLEEGLELLDQALALNPDFVFAMNAKAHILRQLGRLVEAREILGRVLRLRPRYAEAIANLGSVHFAEGDVATAERLYREARALNPRSDKVLFNLALLLHNHGGSPAEIEELYRELLEVRPDDATTLTNLSNLLSNRGEHEEAVAMAARAVELSPDDPVAWNNLATSRVGADDIDGAVAALEAALRVSPDMSQPHVNLMILLAQSDPLRALAHALELPRIDEELGVQSRGNVVQLMDAAADVDHVLVDLMDARQLLDEDEGEAEEIVADSLDAVLALPVGEPGDRRRALARSSVMLALELCGTLGRPADERLTARARELGVQRD